jgi:hypothetical protein
VWVDVNVPGDNDVHFYFNRAHPELPGAFSAPFPDDLNFLPGGIWLYESPPAAILHAGGPQIIQHLLDGKTNAFLPGDQGAANFGEAQGDLTMWSVPSQNRLGGWSPDGKGYRVFADHLPSPVAAVGLSDSHMTALLVDASTSAPPRIWSSSRTTDPAAVKATVSPSLGPGGWYVDRYETWGDWAAYTAGQLSADFIQQGYAFVVVQLSTWKAWQITAAENKQFPEITVSPTHVYVTESNFPTDDHATTRRILRYELAKIPQIAQPLLTKGAVSLVLCPVVGAGLRGPPCSLV